MNKISPIELFWLQFMLYNSPYLLILLHYLLQSALSTVFVWLIVSAILGEGLLWLGFKLGEKLSRKNGLCEKIGIFFVKTGFFLALIIIAAALSEMIAAEFLNSTPKWAIGALFLLPVGYLARKDITSLSWLSVFLMPLALVGDAVLFGGNIANFSWLNIVFEPIEIMNEQSYFIFLRLIPFVMQGLGVIFLYPYLDLTQSKKMFKMASVALGITIVLIFGQCIMANGIFGLIESKRLLFIQIELARILQIGGKFLRIEAVFLWHWTILGVLSAAFYLKAMSSNLKKVGIGQWYIVIGLAFLVWLIVAIFDDLVALNFLVELYAWFSVIVIICGLVILLK